MTRLPAPSAEARPRAGDGCDEAETAERLPEFTKRLSEVGYLDFVTAFNPVTVRQMAFAAARDSAPRELVTLVDLFLLSRPVSSSRAKELLGDAFRTLVDLRLLRTSDDGRAVMPNLILLNVLGCWMFVQQQQVAPMLYFGDDSFGLMHRILGHAKGHCLDLCCGPGAQTLTLATRAPSVVGVDINPAAIALAQINILMNGMADRAEARAGDLYSAVAHERFDTVVANPPLLPVPPSLRYPFVGNGGRDGFRVTARILEGLPGVLAPHGTAHIIGTALGDGLSAHVENELDHWARKHRLHVLMTQICATPLAPGTQMFDGLIGTVCAYSKILPKEVSSIYREWLRSQSATHLVTFFLSITHNGSGIDVMDFGTALPASSLWFV